MATRNRIKGKKIVFEVDGVSYKTDVDSVVLVHEEADDDVVTFADAEAGGAFQYKLNVRAVQSFDADSFHQFFRKHAGETVDFTFAPLGNETPSATQPHLTGTVKLSKKMPDVGGETNSTWTFEMELEVEGDVTDVII